MDTVESLNQSAWDCKYHVVFIPKCRRKALYGACANEDFTKTSILFASGA
jgi:REP element-mobilizing transposase RayT